MSEQRKIKFVPLLCTDHDEEIEDKEGNKKKKKVKATFTGCIYLRPASFDERYEGLEQVNMNVDKQGHVELAEKSNPFGMIRKLVKNSAKFYVGVEIERISDKKKYASFQDLTEDASCDAILMEVAHAVKSGFEPGKN